MTLQGPNSRRLVSLAPRPPEGETGKAGAKRHGNKAGAFERQGALKENWVDKMKKNKTVEKRTGKRKTQGSLLLIAPCLSRQLVTLKALRINGRPCLSKAGLERQGPQVPAQAAGFVGHHVSQGALSPKAKRRIVSQGDKAPALRDKKPAPSLLSINVFIIMARGF